MFIVFIMIIAYKHLNIAKFIKLQTLNMFSQLYLHKAIKNLGKWLPFGEREQSMIEKSFWDIGTCYFLTQV